MLRRILICAALLTPSAAIASDRSPGAQPDGSEKNICDDIGRDRYRCLQVDRCFWDTTDNRCEWLTGGGRCSRYYDKYDCLDDSRCFWDIADERCEPRE